MQLKKLFIHNRYYRTGLFSQVFMQKKSCQKNENPSFCTQEQVTVDVNQNKTLPKTGKIPWADVILQIEQHKENKRELRLTYRSRNKSKPTPHWVGKFQVNTRQFQTHQTPLLRYIFLHIKITIEGRKKSRILQIKNSGNEIRANTILSEQ